MTQRGCPFSCSFCIESVYQDMFGKKNSLRRRSVDVVIEELVAGQAATLGIRQVMFYDDVFTVNPRWLREFAPRYKREVGLPFWCYTYPTTTRKEELAAAEGRRAALDHDGHPVGQRDDAAEVQPARGAAEGHRGGAA